MCHLYVVSMSSLCCLYVVSMSSLCVCNEFQHPYKKISSIIYFINILIPTSWVAQTPGTLSQFWTLSSILGLFVAKCGLFTDQQRSGGANPANQANRLADFFLYSIQEKIVICAPAYFDTSTEERIFNIGRGKGDEESIQWVLSSIES